MKNLVLATIVLSFFSGPAIASKSEHRQLKVSACEGKEQGSTCSFEGKRGSVAGVCTESRRDPDVLKCINLKRKKEVRNQTKENL